ncbi:hypothetical protein G7Y89_g5300 [Cudoniella acicularis]|uniref:C2H2-type domain-containing protein n=1 Tax=Cudoniella acicularis TaxID=354080 RepID=A0A8H4RP96_9HELO|nr:hypothetical protein G7Y89_g5300 [Cudoniella acicularis]
MPKDSPLPPPLPPPRYLADIKTKSSSISQNFDASLLEKLDGRRAENIPTTAKDRNTSALNTTLNHPESKTEPRQNSQLQPLSLPIRENRAELSESPTSSQNPDFPEEETRVQKLYVEDYMVPGDYSFPIIGQKRQALSLSRHDEIPHLQRVSSAGDLFKTQESPVSRSSPVIRHNFGYSGSNHSSSSIRSYGSNNSYACSVRSARGIRDEDTDIGFEEGMKQPKSRTFRSVKYMANPLSLSPGARSRRNSATEIVDARSKNFETLEDIHQTWDEFCVSQLVAFLQICTPADRMIRQGGNANFISYQASPKPGQPESQLQTLHHRNSKFSLSRSSIRSHRSHISQNSSSTASSFYSQVSDADMSLLFAEYKGKFAIVYKNVKDITRQSKVQKVLRPERSRKPQASISILSSATELGYVAKSEYSRSRAHLVSRKFIPRLICECCLKKPKKFETPEELIVHEKEKQYQCAYCPNRFKNKNEAERHQVSLHKRRHSWSCAALSGYAAAFHPSLRCPNEADTCGYCGDEFPRSGTSKDGDIKVALDGDWDLRIDHLQEMHKFGECNYSRSRLNARPAKMHASPATHSTSLNTYKMEIQIKPIYAIPTR